MTTKERAEKSLPELPQHYLFQLSYHHCSHCLPNLPRQTENILLLQKARCCLGTITAKINFLSIIFFYPLPRWQPLFSQESLLAAFPPHFWCKCHQWGLATFFGAKRTEMFLLDWLQQGWKSELLHVPSSNRKEAPRSRLPTLCFSFPTGNPATPNIHRAVNELKIRDMEACAANGNSSSGLRAVRKSLESIFPSPSPSNAEKGKTKVKEKKNYLESNLGKKKQFSELEAASEGLQKRGNLC